MKQYLLWIIYDCIIYDINYYCLKFIIILYFSELLMNHNLNNSINLIFNVYNIFINKLNKIK
jgi:hypothetical protein